MQETRSVEGYNERISKEAPQLAALLEDMKGGLDTLRSKVQALTAKIKGNQNREVQHFHSLLNVLVQQQRKLKI